MLHFSVRVVCSQPPQTLPSSRDLVGLLLVVLPLSFGETCRGNLDLANGPVTWWWWCPTPLACACCRRMKVWQARWWVKINLILSLERTACRRDRCRKRLPAHSHAVTIARLLLRFCRRRVVAVLCPRRVITVCSDTSQVAAFCGNPMNMNKSIPYAIRNIVRRVVWAGPHC